MSRITNGMMASNFLKNYMNNKQDLNDYMDQLSTGKKFDQVSEAPLDATKALKLKTDIKFNKQYKKNVDSGISWLKTTDQALDDTLKALQKARDLAVQADNDSTTTADKEKIEKEIDELRAHLVQIGNSKYGDRYIFNGSKTKTNPYQNSPGNYINGSLSTEELNREISQGIKVKINVTGDEVGDGGFSQIFSDLEQLSSDLQSGDKSGIQQGIANIDDHIEGVLGARAKVGASQNRLEMTKSRLEGRKISYTEELSKTEDVDMAKAITNLKMEQNVYRASLSTGAKIIQPSLVDFLR